MMHEEMMLDENTGNRIPHDEENLCDILDKQGDKQGGKHYSEAHSLLKLENIFFKRLVLPLKNNQYN